MGKILIVDYGSQYNQLISRRIREMNVYSEIVPYHAVIDQNPDDVLGIILSGGPNSVYDDNAPKLSQKILELNIPILGICYGMQILMQTLGGTVEASQLREYGKSKMTLTKSSKLTDKIKPSSIVWMSHGDHVTKLPDDFVVLGKTDSSLAIVANEIKSIYAVQFHPEVTHTEEGHQMLRNFVFSICGAKPDWNIENFIENSVNKLRKTIGDKQIILGLSGGVDSSVAAALLNQAVGKQLTCIFVDTGLLRKNEVQHVMNGYGGMPELNIKVIDAKKRFFDALKGVIDPEKKRKIIGKVFFDVFEQAKFEHHDAEFLAQGTIYPDVIESQSVHGPSATIKSHHNVGGVPKTHSFKIIEPLKELFKDEVREVGIALGLSKSLVYRHPFPGPGLGIRIIGEVTPEKVEILQQADDIFIQELRKADLYDHVSQAFAILLPVKTVGVMGDLRTYEHVLAIKSVNTTDFMTAQVSRLPYDFLDHVSTKIINEVHGINRIVYDVTSKPPGTIEWE